MAERSIPDDPDLINLGKERKTTKYSLRVKPVRNCKYFNTEIIIPEDPIKPPSGNSYEINTIRAIPKPDLNPILPKGILKIKTNKGSLNHSLEISFFENFSKPAKKAIREAFILQKQLKTPTPNQKLADFIILGQFRSDKNTLFFQHTEDSIEIYGRKKAQKSQKMVRLKKKWDQIEKPSKNLLINLTNLVKSTYYSCSFSELSLERR